MILCRTQLNECDQIPPEGENSWVRINCFKKPASDTVCESLIINILLFVESKYTNVHTKSVEIIYTANNFDSNFEGILLSSVNKNIYTLMNKKNTNKKNFNRVGHVLCRRLLLFCRRNNMIPLKTRRAQVSIK